VLALLRRFFAVEEHALIGAAHVRSVAVGKHLDGRTVHVVGVNEPFVRDDVVVARVVGVDRALDRRPEVLAPALAEVQLVRLLAARPEGAPRSPWERARCVQRWTR
jgi:hypothetical protein